MNVYFTKDAVTWKVAAGTALAFAVMAAGGAVDCPPLMLLGALPAMFLTILLPYAFLADETA